jgi:hypothetical protein
MASPLRHNGGMTTGVIRTRFIHALAKRCGDMMSAAEHRDSLLSLMYGFHNLAGLAATYGFHAVTEVSRHCELLCAAALDQNRTLSPLDRARLIAAVISIRHYGAFA